MCKKMRHYQLVSIKVTDIDFVLLLLVVYSCIQLYPNFLMTREQRWKDGARQEHSIPLRMFMRSVDRLISLLAFDISVLHSLFSS
jgi:hypothetical protein